MTETELQFEQLITGLIDQNYSICDGFLAPDLLAGLRKNLLAHHTNGAMHPAGVGRHFDFQRNLDVRGDVIRWIDDNPEDIFEQALINKIGQFIQFLNETCYTRINQMEFHYAYYEAGSFYKRHLDQFKNHRGRKFSLVIYLNDHWENRDGGNLRLYVDGERIEDVFPVGGRAVFFKSDELEHEVLASFHRPRLSIAGWLKSV